MKKIFYLALFILGFPANAYAYLDPGVGSILFQGLAAGLLFLGVFWRHVKNTIKRIFRMDTPEEEINKTNKEKTSGEQSVEEDK